MTNTIQERKSGPSRWPERDGSSGSGGRFKGVRKRKWGKWVAEVRLPKSRERIWLGSYDSPEKAARAYDAAVYCLRGPAATFNFPDTLPEIPSWRSLNPVEIREVAARFANEVGSGGGGTDAVVQLPTEIESPAVSVATENLLRGDNWGFMETFVPESGHARPDLGVFPPLGDFPAENYVPVEEEEDETSGGAFFQCPGLWNF